MSTINMSKNQKINMTKDDGSSIKNIFMGINWDMNRYAGEANADLDIQGFVTNSSRDVEYSRDVVNYHTYDKKTYPWIEFSGDNQTGADGPAGITFNGKHYDEYFIINADQFPADRSEFVVCLTIYRAVQRMQNFGMISNARMTICDYDNPAGDVWEYNLTDDENFENLNAVEIGRLFRGSNGFRFQALGSGYVGGMTELFKNFGLEIDEGRD